MSAPIPLRRDFDASQLRSLAKKTKDGPQARRLLALAAIYDGATRSEAAMIGGVGLQIIRDWVLHFNERSPDGLLNGKSPGQPSKLNDVQRQAIARMIESGPIPSLGKPPNQGDNRGKADHEGNGAAFLFGHLRGPSLLRPRVRLAEAGLRPEGRPPLPGKARCTGAGRAQGWRCSHLQG